MSTRNALHHNGVAIPRQSTVLHGEVSLEEIATVMGGEVPTPLQTMLSHARRVFYRQHEILYHQGSTCETVTFITSGLVKLITHLPNGRARIVRLHRRGSVLGLGGLRVRGNEHTAVAVTAVTALRLPLSAVDRLRTEDPGAYLRLVERWHDYLRDADRWITQFSTGAIRARVARLLAFLTEFECEQDDGEVQLLTCEEMSSILGVTKESVSRVLAEFKRTRILDRGGRARSNEIFSADTERLRDIAWE